jgi:endogenous inhibitor of DNA gyrase (YacG/DUF329 family)
MTKLPSAEVAQNPIVNARRGTISARSEAKAAPISKKPCLSCGQNIRLIRPKQRFCSSRCRLLYWAAGEIVKEYVAGNASGLQDIIDRLKV